MSKGRALPLLAKWGLKGSELGLLGQFFAQRQREATTCNQIIKWTKSALQFTWHNKQSLHYIRVWRTEEAGTKKRKKEKKQQQQRRHRKSPQLWTCSAAEIEIRDSRFTIRRATDFWLPLTLNYYCCWFAWLLASAQSAPKSVRIEGPRRCVCN